MPKRYIKLFFSLILGSLFQIYEGQCQVSVYGPTCVIPGTEYQYIIGGNWDDYSTMQLCVQGGSIAETDSGCFNGTPLALIRIIWKEDALGNISITSSDGNISLNVERTTALNGGRIDSVLVIQTIKKDSTPLSIHCSEASGGNCSPSYSYQWQQSSDNIIWTDMEEATSAGLEFSIAILETTYYRRKVTETISHSIKYSDTAIVIVESLSEKQE